MNKNISFFPEEEIEVELFKKDDSGLLNNKYDSRNIDSQINTWLKSISKSFDKINSFTKYLMVVNFAVYPVHMFLDVANVFDKQNELGFPEYFIYFLTSTISLLLVRKLFKVCFFYKDKMKVLLHNKSFQTEILNKMYDSFVYLVNNNVHYMSQEKFDSKIEEIISDFSSHSINSSTWYKIIIFFKEIDFYNKKVKINQEKNKLIRSLNFAIKKKEKISYDIED